MRVIRELTNPRAIEALARAMRDGGTHQVQFYISTGFEPQQFCRAMVRAAYLAAFRRLGYAFARHGVIQFIRQRLVQDDYEHPPLCLM